jgi:PadR family transcriptional regulator PadR
MIRYGFRKHESTDAQRRVGILYPERLKERRSISFRHLSIAEKRELIVVEGTLYPLLTRLKNSGLLNYRWEESTQGPPRKYYSLTKAGEDFHEELKTSWDELVYAVKQTQKP